jgi:hypothetical protein
MTDNADRGESGPAFAEGLRAYLQSEEFRQDLEREGSGAHKLAQTLVSFAAAMQTAVARISEAAKDVDLERVTAAFKEGQAWIEAAPQKLKEALATEGLVPHPDLGLVHLRKLTTVFEASGAHAAATYLTNLHEEVLASEHFRKDAQERWEQVGRWRVFSEVLAAYDAKLYSVAIPAAFAQAEGIVAHLFGLKGMKFPEFKERLAEMHDEDMDLYGPLVREVVAGLLLPFEHGAPSARLNRHAVMHGGDVAYGTKENAIAAIIWADYIMGTARDFKAIAVPKTGAEAAEVMSERG